jgi:hypothetical protein
MKEEDAASATEGEGDKRMRLSACILSDLLTRKATSVAKGKVLKSALRRTHFSMKKGGGSERPGLPTSNSERHRRVAAG